MLRPPIFEGFGRFWGPPPLPGCRYGWAPAEWWSEDPQGPQRRVRGRLATNNSCYLCIHLSVYLWFYVSDCIYVSMYPCIHVSVYLWFYVSDCICVSMYLCIHVSMYLCIYGSRYLIVSMYLCIYVSMYLSIYGSITDTWIHGYIDT